MLFFSVLTAAHLFIFLVILMAGCRIWSQGFKNACSTQLNIKFKMLIRIKIPGNSAFSGLDKPRMLFFRLINVEMPTIVGTVDIYEQKKFHAQWNYEIFNSLGPDCIIT